MKIGETMFEKVNNLISIMKNAQKVLEFGESEITHDQGHERKDTPPKEMAQELAKLYSYVDASQAPRAVKVLEAILSGNPIDENDKNYGYLEINNFYRSSIPFKEWDKMIKLYEQ